MKSTLVTLFSLLVTPSIFCNFTIPEDDMGFSLWGHEKEKLHSVPALPTPKSMNGSLEQAYCTLFEIEEEEEENPGHTQIVIAATKYIDLVITTLKDQGYIIENFRGIGPLEPYNEWYQWELTIRKDLDWDKP